MAKRTGLASGWTEERRRKQRTAIHRWKPWKKSTGPISPEGKAAIALNGLKTGEHTQDIRDLRALIAQVNRQRQTLMTERESVSGKNF